MKLARDDRTAETSRGGVTGYDLSDSDSHRPRLEPITSRERFHKTRPFRVTNGQVSVEAYRKPRAVAYWRSAHWLA